MFSSTQILSTESSTLSPVHDNTKPLPKGAGRWTKEEHQRFIEGVKKFGKNWKQVEEYVGTRTGAQVRSHAQKFFNKLEKEQSLHHDGSQIELSPQVKESLRKMSETSISTNHSLNEEGHNDFRMEEIPPLSTNMIPVSLKPLVQQSTLESPINVGLAFQESMSVPSGSPKMTPFAETSTFRRNPRKMSEDVIVKPSLSMFEVILSKIRTSKNGIDFPKLSDLVEMNVEPRIDFSNYRNRLLGQNSGFAVRQNESVAFRTNPRKISEDNILISTPVQSFRKTSCMDLHEFEQFAKKVKMI